MAAPEWVRPVPVTLWLKLQLLMFMAYLETVAAQVEKTLLSVG
jgi:hypothetical protein